MIPFTTMSVKVERSKDELREYAKLEGVSLAQLRSGVRQGRRDNPIMRRLYSRSLFADVRPKRCTKHSRVYHLVYGKACC